jgi:hypothetical protein
MKSGASRPRHDLAIDRDVEILLRDSVGSAPYTHYSADYNVGTNTIFTGGSTASHLLLPLIPGR